MTPPCLAGKVAPLMQMGREYAFPCPTLYGPGTGAHQQPRTAYFRATKKSRGPYSLGPRHKERWRLLCEALAVRSSSIGSQPQRDVGRLHRLLHHSYEVVA